MANLTIVVDSDVLQKARLRAVQQGTSVNAVLREYLAQYAGAQHSRAQAMRNLLSLSKQSTARKGRRRWSREELHER